MSIATMPNFQNNLFDAVSQASTDGDDNHIRYAKTKPSRKNIAKNKSKSSLCKNFSEKGYCPYGFKCQFAHGVEQLKCNIDENSYKTKPCNSFWKKNYCPYGFRCNFSHSNPIIQEQQEAEEPTKVVNSVYRQIKFTIKKQSGSRLFFGVY